MDAITTVRARPAHIAVLLTMVLALGATLGTVAPARAQDASPAPAASVPASPSPASSMCESAEDLRMYVGFLRGQSLSEDGLLPILVGVTASIYEVDRLLGLVDDVYRPLVQELSASLRDLGASVRGFREQATIGAGLVRLGESVTRVGLAMDALSAGLREPCAVGTSPVPSVVPSASPPA